METNNEKIIHARNLLKKFRKQQQNNFVGPNNGGGSETGSSIFHPTINSNNMMKIETSCNESICNEGISHLSKSRESSRPPSTIAQGNDLLTNSHVNHEQFRCHSVPKAFYSENIESNSLLWNVSTHQKEQQLEEALFKLQSLQKHYSDLYKTYNQLVNQNGEDKNQNKYIEQINQLRTTLAVTMDEKTALQSELREFKENMELMLSTTRNHQNDQLNSTTSNYELEIQLTKLISQRDQLLETIKSQSEQIEQQRRECSNLEAKFVLVQQDRLDSQARLKSLFEEKLQLEKNIGQMKQDLGMRDIYLRQLTKHIGNEQYFPGQQNLIDGNSLENSERKRMEEKLEKLKQELEDMQKQMAALKENYTISMNQANGQIEKLEGELNNLNTLKSEMESRNGFLEEQLRIAQNDIQTLSSSKAKDTLSQPIVDVEELSKLREQIEAIVDEKEKAKEKLEEMSILLKSKEQEIETIKLLLVEAEAKIFQLEQTHNLHSTINSDAAILSSQLQNEKATVSRAIAQNIELKSQLSELQDKFVQVVNESAAKEDERMTTLITIERLKKEIDEYKLGKEGEQQRTTNSLNGLSMMKAAIVAIEPSKQMYGNEEELNNGNNVVEKCSKQSKISSKEIQTDQQNDDKGYEMEQNESKMSGQLDQRLVELFKEKEQFKMDNQKFQYWLTALETENESIGEYIALYRFQRGNIQKKISEKDQQLQKFRQENLALMSKLNELQSSVQTYLNNKNTTKTTIGTSTEQNNTISSNVSEVAIREDPPTGLEDAQIECNNEIGQLKQALENSRVIISEKQSTCSNAQQRAQIHCTGCLECRGEMYTL